MRVYNRRHIDFLKKHLRIAKEQREILCGQGEEELAVFMFGAFRGIVLQMLVDESMRTEELNRAVADIMDAILKPTAKAAQHTARG